MLESFRNVSNEQIATLLIAGAAVCLAILYRAGYLVIPGRMPQKTVSSEPTVTVRESIRVSEPPSTQALVDGHRAVQASMDKRQQQLESELEALKAAKCTGGKQ